jgi:hypothetical protein
MSRGDTDRLKLAGRVFIGAVLTGVIALAVFLVHEVRKVPTQPPTRERTSDVVVPRVDRQYPTGSDLFARGAPQSQPAPGPTNEIPIPPERQLQPVKRIMPKDLPDPHNPPQYTKTLAAPPANPTPPNPFVPPPIEMNPDRSKPPY